MRHRRVMPLVFACWIDPGGIVVEHNGRNEHEVIVDPIWLIDPSLDLPPDVPEDAEEPYKVPATVLAEWQAACDRYEERKNRWKPRLGRDA